MKTAKTTIVNGNISIDVSVSLPDGAEKWVGGENARLYYDVQHTGKRPILTKFYEILEGGTRDEIIRVGDSVFGFELSVSALGSHRKAEAARDGVKDLATQIAAQ